MTGKRLPDLKCPLCGAEEIAFLFESGGFNYDRCSACGYVRRREPAGLTISVHQDEAYMEKYVDEAYHERKSSRIILECETYSNGKGDVLDIGCSKGMFLLEAQRLGWRAHGIDVSANAIRIARGRGLSDVEVKSVLDTDFPPESFNLVVFNHVLEHLDGPVETLSKIAGWLKPQGLIYIGVPNFGSYSARKQGKNWDTLEPREHISQFTPSTLKLTVEKTGCLEVVALKGNRAHGEAPRKIMQYVNHWLNRMKDRLMISKEMMLIARKKKA